MSLSRRLLVIGLGAASLLGVGGAEGEAVTSGADAGNLVKLIRAQGAETPPASTGVTPVLWPESFPPGEVAQIIVAAKDSKGCSWTGVRATVLGVSSPDGRLQTGASEGVALKPAMAQDQEAVPGSLTPGFVRVPSVGGMARLEVTGPENWSQIRPAKVRVYLRLELDGSAKGTDCETEASILERSPLVKEVVFEKPTARLEATHSENRTYLLHRSPWGARAEGNRGALHASGSSELPLRETSGLAVVEGLKGS
ncbi:MAG: hypothetical protein KDD47_16750, partial [Acidobacteria bacterium]|nr:hypothetical protein [Acidobacteriota bacterium]